MSARDRFWACLGAYTPLNKGNPTAPGESTCEAHVFISQAEHQRSHWSIVLNISSYLSGFQFSSHMRPADARQLGQQLLDAADLMEAEQVKHLASAPPAEVAA